jgi:hypothetical protein
MNKPVKYKKLRKLLTNPNMFFYDMFRKRVFKDAPQAVLSNTAAPESTSPVIDILEVRRLGVVEYIRKYLQGVVGPEDGQDPNSLLIWNGYTSALVSLIGSLRDAMSMDVSIYTLGGGYSLTLSASEKFDSNGITKGLSRRPDFVIEMSNLMGELYVLHIYLFDLAPTGIATVRSSKAWLRKFPVESMESIFLSEALSRKESPVVDAVYTWVNHADPDWQSFWLETFPDEEFDPDRYTSNDELRYSLRSLNKYAPWLNKIYIVSNCSKPVWLNDAEKVEWVKHEDIFPDVSVLPTFNSHAIETCLHRINGLSENFIYLNDDFILSQPCLPSDFFDETGRSLAYFESYGMVADCHQDEDLPDYLRAAKNSRALIQKVEASYEARNLHRHVPYALKASILFEIESRFSEAFNLTREAKRRSSLDVNVTSFLYHHYAYVKGAAVKGDVPGLIVRPENVLQIVGKDSYRYKVLCFNDGNGSAEDQSYKTHTQQFFDKRLSERAPWEFTGS